MLCATSISDDPVSCISMYSCSILMLISGVFWICVQLSWLGTLGTSAPSLTTDPIFKTLLSHLPWRWVVVFFQDLSISVASFVVFLSSLSTHLKIGKVGAASTKMPPVSVIFPFDQWSLNYQMCLTGWSERGELLPMIGYDTWIPGIRTALQSTGSRKIASEMWNEIYQIWEACVAPKWICLGLALKSAPYTLASILSLDTIVIGKHAK